MLLLALVYSVIAYDYQSLEITWRPTDCKFNKCEPGYVSDDFNIHGLWPDYFNGSYPQFCKELPFNITTETREVLKVYWRSFKKDYESFWVHEWKKHGTCMEPLLTCDNYFLKTVKIFQEINIMKRFNDKGVFPCNLKKYSIETLSSSFEKKTLFFCKKKNDAYYLSAVHVCYDLDFNVIDCVQNQYKCGTGVFIPSIN